MFAALIVLLASGPGETGPDAVAPFLPLLLPLYYPHAMRIATDHILGKSETKIWV